MNGGRYGEGRDGVGVVKGWTGRRERGRGKD